MKPTHTEADYEAALVRVADFMDAREGTPEGEEFDALVEDRHFPVVFPGTGKVRRRFEEEERHG